MELTLNKVGAAAGSLMAIIMLLAALGSMFVWKAEADDYHTNQEKLAEQVVDIAALVQILGGEAEMRRMSEERAKMLQDKADAAQEAEARAAAAKLEAEAAVIKRLCADGVLSGDHCS